MPATITVPELARYARHVGITIEASQNPRDLYALADPGGHVLYIGKDESATRTRARNESAWGELDLEKLEVSAIAALIRRNQASHTHLHFAGFDAGKAIEAGREWDVDSPELADPNFTLSVPDVEKTLIRIVVRLGVPVGNSQFASQWETPIGTLWDRLAVWAVTTEPFPGQHRGETHGS